MILEVGMVIYTTDGSVKYTIDRVTKTQAIAKTRNNYELRFKRDVVNDKWFNEIGAASWNRTNYSVETPALIEKHKRKLLLHKFEHINAESLSNETLEAILTIVNGERHE